MSLESNGSDRVEAELEEDSQEEDKNDSSVEHDNQRVSDDNNVLDLNYEAIDNEITCNDPNDHNDADEHNDSQIGSVEDDRYSAMDIEDLRDEPDGDPDDPDDSNFIPDSDSEDEQDADCFNFNHPSLNNQLRYTGNRTVREELIIQLAISMRHEETYESLMDNFRAKNVSLGLKFFPSSIEELWTVLNKKEAGVTKYLYCGICSAFLGKKPKEGLVRCVVPTCTYSAPANKVPYFIALSVRKQLTYFLRTPGVAQLLRYKATREKHGQNTREDIYDGDKYKEMERDGNILSFKWNLSYVINTDGFKIGKSAKLEVWPLFLKLNELPPNLRQKHMFLAALYVGRKPPNMNTFLQPFVREANSLASEGIWWAPENDVEVRSLVVPTCFCADAKARCAMLNMASYQSEFGCTWCYVRGQSLVVMKFPLLPAMPLPQLRTDMDIRQAARNEQEAKGVIGPTELMNLNGLDLADGSAMDDLHPIYEGTVKHHTELLLKNVCLLPKEQVLRTIDVRLLSIKPPNCISRKPGSIRNRKSYKGSEWLNWLLYYGPVCMRGRMLQQGHLEHFQKLSYAVFLLSKDVIEENDIELADELIVSYVREFQDRHGTAEMFYNVHVLLHLVKTVRNWSNLWCYSTFCFESWNFRLLRKITSPNGVLLQIVMRYLMKLLVEIAAHHDPDLSEEVKHLLRDILSKKRRTVVRDVNGSHLLGAEQVRPPTAAEMAVLTREGIACARLSTFPKVIHNQIEYHKDGASKSEFSDNTNIFTWYDSFCTIKSIVDLQVDGGEHVCGMFVLEHIIAGSEGEAKHIARMQPNSSVFSFVRMSQVRSLALKMCADGEVFFVPVVNQHHID